MSEENAEQGAAVAGPDGQAPALAIGLLGAWEVRLHGRPLRSLHSRRGRWLLALLGLRKGGAVEREWLAGTLWPDSSETHALYNLRRTLADLHSVLGSEGHRIQVSMPRTLALDLAGARRRAAF